LFPQVLRALGQSAKKWDISAARSAAKYLSRSPGNKAAYDAALA
jgi:hypothetical protein